METIIIDQIEYKLTDEKTILECAQEINITIPTLCHNEHIKPYGACRLCLVEVAFKNTPDITKLMPACTTPAQSNYIVTTQSKRIHKARQFILEMFLSRCPNSKEIKTLAEEFGITSKKNDKIKEYLLNRAKTYIDTNCILCGLCVRVCQEVTERHALGFSGRGMKRKVKTPYDQISEPCIGCGSCAYVCPTKTITVEEA